MGLREREQRVLHELDRQLSEQDRRLARALTTGRPLRRYERLWMCAATMLVVPAVVLIVVGLAQTRAVLIAIGAMLLVVTATAVVRVWPRAARCAEPRRSRLRVGGIGLSGVVLVAISGRSRREDVMSEFSAGAVRCRWRRRGAVCRRGLGRGALSAAGFPCPGRRFPVLGSALALRMLRPPHSARRVPHR